MEDISFMLNQTKKFALDEVNDLRDLNYIFVKKNRDLIIQNLIKIKPKYIDHTHNWS